MMLTLPVTVGQEVSKGIAHHGEHCEVDADTDYNVEQCEHLAGCCFGVSQTIACKKDEG